MRRRAPMQRILGALAGDRPPDALPAMQERRRDGLAVCSEHRRPGSEHVTPQAFQAPRKTRVFSCRRVSWRSPRSRRAVRRWTRSGARRGRPRGSCFKSPSRSGGARDQAWGSAARKPTAARSGPHRLTICDRIPLAQERAQGPQRVAQRRCEARRARAPNRQHSLPCYNGGRRDHRRGGERPARGRTRFVGLSAGIRPRNARWATAAAPVWRGVPPSVLLPGGHRGRPRRFEDVCCDGDHKGPTMD